jgi:hypothetical protein
MGRGMPGCPGSWRDDGVFRDGTVWFDADAVPKLCSRSDARVAADADMVAYDCFRADVYGVSDDYLVTYPRFPVDPAASSHAASGTDVGARFHVGGGLYE